MKKVILAGLLSSVSILAHASDAVSFDYAQVGYVALDRDARPGDPTELSGFQIAGSKSLINNLFVAGEYTATSEIGVDVTFAKAGLGYRYDLNDTVVLYTQLSYIQVELGSRMAGTFEDKGTQLDFGVRTHLNENLELSGAVEYQKDADEDHTAIVVGGTFHFNDEFAAYADYKTESDSDTVYLGVRYHY